MHSPFRHTALLQTTTPRQGHDLADDWSLLSAYAHFAARLGAFFYETRCFDNNVPLDNTAPIYLINLLWKLGLGFRSESELHYFSICHGE